MKGATLPSFSTFVSVVEAMPEPWVWPMVVDCPPPFFFLKSCEKRELSSSARTMVGNATPTASDSSTAMETHCKARFERA